MKQRRFIADIQLSPRFQNLNFGISDRFDVDVDSFGYKPSGQIKATSHEFSPQKVAKDWKSPYFRKI